MKRINSRREEGRSCLERPNPNGGKKPDGIHMEKFREGVTQYPGQWARGITLLFRKIRNKLPKYRHKKKATAT